jgi:hypothetical protein
MKQILPDKVYDVLKWIAIIALPAFSIFYDRIGAVWGLPYTEQICETLDAVAVLLGALLCVSAIQYAADKTAQGQKSPDSAEFMAEVDNLYASDEERENG